jgi:hypothetical protein
MNQPWEKQCVFLLRTRFATPGKNQLLLAELVCRCHYFCLANSDHFVCKAGG